MTDHKEKETDAPNEKTEENRQPHDTENIDQESGPSQENKQGEEPKDERVGVKKAENKDVLSRISALFGFILGLLLAIYFFLELVIIFLLVFIGMVIGGNPKRVNALKQHIGDSIESFKKILQDK